LAKRGVKPDVILSSPATRALKTAKIIAKRLDYKLKDIVVDERLYAVGADDLLDVVRKLWRQAGPRGAGWPQPRADRTGASLLKRDPSHADVRRRRVHVRREIVVECR
jgi:broad specificity phosphatase PhoE